MPQELEKPLFVPTLFLMILGVFEKNTTMNLNDETTIRDIFLILQ